MALDWSAPDVETARILREEGGPYSPPERRLPIKAVLSVGLCVAAAGLAGAAVAVRSAARAPAGQEHPWAFVQADEAWKKYLTDECSDRLHALEEEAKDTGKTHQGEGAECKDDSEHFCTMRFTKGGFSETCRKCFPVVCQEPNILRGIQEDNPNLLDLTPDELQDLTLTCAEPSVPWKKYLTEECSDLLHALEKEAEDAGRTHQGEEVECKDSEQICTATFTTDGFSEAHPKCFPVVCQEANILRGLQEDKPDLLDLSVTCG